MGLPTMVGQGEARATLARAAQQGSLPQSILLHGPRGAGKERLGLWLGQMLVCTERGAEPCGSCSGCRLAVRLEHPDIHWFFPLPRPDASSPEKLRERLEDLRAAELEQWREQPLRIPAFDRAPAHFVAAIRTLQRISSLRPAVAERKVFVIGDAELMVPQESSPEAANAFLKLLEEPPPATTLVLTSSRPGALLPTIRSRVLAIRVGALDWEEVVKLLVEANLATEPVAREIAQRSRGSLRRAIRLAERARDGIVDPTDDGGRELFLAALASDGIARLAAAHGRRPAGARAELLAELDALAEWIRDLAAVASGGPDLVTNPAALPILGRAVEQRKVSAAAAARVIERVTAARELASGNVNPQLIVADLLAHLQHELLGNAPTGRMENP